MAEAGYWVLDAESWILDSGEIGSWITDGGQRSSDNGFRMSDTSIVA